MAHIKVKPQNYNRFVEKMNEHFYDQKGKVGSRVKENLEFYYPYVKESVVCYHDSQVVRLFHEDLVEECLATKEHLENFFNEKLNLLQVIEN